MNLFRGLIWDNEISLTLADTTELVREGIRLHKLSPPAAKIFGKVLSALAFFSACLKEEKGEISLSLQKGGKEFIGASGNAALRLRGYITPPVCLTDTEEQTERQLFEKDGSFTVVRDDGYSRPFVGSCALEEGGTLDELIEEYYRVSEQLPTRIQTVVELDEGGRCAFAGVIALQPLPFASLKNLEKVERYDLSSRLAKFRAEGANGSFEKEYESRLAVYSCNCSREYLSALLVTLGEGQLREVIRTEGAVRVHCHYCNTDYEFTGEDVDRLFPKKK